MTFNALGGADNVTVDDLTGTDVTSVDLDLAGALGGTTGDGQTDRVVVNGTAETTLLTVAGGAGDVSVSGLAPTVELLHAEATDQLDFETFEAGSTRSPRADSPRARSSCSSTASSSPRTTRSGTGAGPPPWGPAPSSVARRWPREESNLRTQLRRLPLYPLSYGAQAGKGIPPQRSLRCARSVAVAQLVELRVVVPVAAGSSPVRHLETTGLHRGPVAHSLKPGRARPMRSSCGGSPGTAAPEWWSRSRGGESPAARTCGRARGRGRRATPSGS